MSVAQVVPFSLPALPSWEAHDEGARWYAIHTVSQHEKQVTALLGEKRIFSFLPLLDQVHHWSDRRKVVQVPLFSCYTFVRMCSTPETRMQVLRTPGVIDFVGVQGRGIPIPDQEIEGIRTVLREKIACGLHPFCPRREAGAHPRGRTGRRRRRVRRTRLPWDRGSLRQSPKAISFYSCRGL